MYGGVPNFTKQFLDSASAGIRGAAAPSACCTLWSALDEQDDDSAESDRSSEFSDIELACDELENETSWLFATPEIDLPISRAGLLVTDLQTPSAAEFD